MMRVWRRDSVLAAAASILLSSASMSSGPIRSGSNLIWKDAFAGQISVTPAIWASRTARVSDRLLKNASSDISSSTSTKTCSSPPNAQRAGRLAWNATLPLQGDQRLPGLDLALVLDQEAMDSPGGVGRHRIERLHHLDQADHVAAPHRVAALLVGRAVRRRSAEERARHGRADFLHGH